MNCRLKPSNIKGAGVGVFAVSKIDKNINPFPGCNTDLIPLSNIDYNNMSDLKQKMIRDFCYISKGYWRVPKDFNKLDVSWYVNSSDSPNLSFSVETGEYTTLREISEGEELTYEYLIYD